MFTLPPLKIGQSQVINDNNSNVYTCLSGPGQHSCLYKKNYHSLNFTIVKQHVIGSTRIELFYLFVLFLHFFKNTNQRIVYDTLLQRENLSIMSRDVE